MKIAPIAFALFLAPLALRAADTAYAALRVLGKENSQALNHVVEVRGRGGSPAPHVWQVVLDEPRARGGVRELEIQGGRVVSEKTPLGRNVGAPMNFNALNLDSEGAFTIANQEAQKAGVPFDRVDYVLKSGTGSGSPVWQLSLFSAGHGQVASLQIAADSGTILNQNGFTLRGPHPYPRVDDHRVIEEDREYVDRAPEDPRDRRYEDRREYREDRRDYYDPDAPSGPPIRDVPSFFNRVGKHFERRGLQIKRFFTQ